MCQSATFLNGLVRLSEIICHKTRLFSKFMGFNEPNAERLINVYQPLNPGHNNQISMWLELESSEIKHNSQKRKRKEERQTKLEAAVNEQ